MVVCYHVGVAVFGLVHFQVGVLPGELLTGVDGLEGRGSRQERVNDVRIERCMRGQWGGSAERNVAQVAAINCSAELIMNAQREIALRTKILQSINNSEAQRHLFSRSKQ